MSPKQRSLVAGGSVLLALVLVPAPLLPPGPLVGALQALLGASRAAAYLVGAIALQTLFYGALGAAGAFAVGPGTTRGGRWLRLLLLPLAVVGLAVLIRSLRLGHVPLLANAAVPIAACAAGTVTALALRQNGWRLTLLAATLLALLLAWLNWPGVSAASRAGVEARLRSLVAAGPSLPAGAARFGRMLQVAFAPAPEGSATASPIEANVAAVLALGIAVGHERLARHAGLERDAEVVRAAAALRQGTALRGREDWARHFCVSAALAVVENAFVSDVGGLLKEEIDSLTQGTGFSFADLAADRAGVRFASAATASRQAALAAQARIAPGLAEGDYFPEVMDLSENLTPEQFRRDYGGVGAGRYREVVADIEARLDRCAALR